MAKAKISFTASPASGARRARRAVSKPLSESSLLLMRMKELDREFARQTKQLTSLTKKLGKRLTGLDSK